MNLSIIDIGTQSLKHYIFEVEGTSKKSLHYKRYSEANLGEHETIAPETIQRNIQILAGCLNTNKIHNVSKLQILGTEILRKAHNAKEFVSAVRDLSGHTIQIISQDEEARYLYEGFVSIVPKDVVFAAMNIGGGSTEVVTGDPDHLIDFKKIPFGVKFLRKMFSTDTVMNWEKLDAYLSKEIDVSQKVPIVFVTGVLDFILTVGPHLGFVFDTNDTPNHPIRIGMQAYVGFLNVLRKTPIEALKKLYPKDPGYADNFVTGQSVYVAIARKLSAEIIIPSNNDLTDGVIYRLVA